MTYLANAGTHIPAGLASPWIIILGFALFRHKISSAFYDYPWFLVVFLVFVVSFFGERMPDWIEPSENDPRHRFVIHWLGALALVYIGIFLFAFPFLPWLALTYDSLIGLLIVSYLAGYASHFVLDYIIS